jgi:diketogulonate reductase-like aldo/keto reductase
METIPNFGLGTWLSPDDSTTTDAVRYAIEVAGYRHIDTAAVYQNEESVGQGIRASGVPRDQIFLTTKLWNDDHGYDATKRAFDTSLRKLGVNYVDLYLIHWPNPKRFRGSWAGTNADTWRAIEELYAQGRAKAIGVSNFRVKHLEELFKTAKVKPMVNQIRLCPGDTQDEVVNFCRANNILLEAYSPLGVGKIFTVKEIQQLAAKYKKTVAQVGIRWSLDRGYVPLPKSVTPARIIENTGVFDFRLTPEDIELLANLTGRLGHGYDPDQAPF